MGPDVHIGCVRHPILWGQNVLDLYIFLPQMIQRSVVADCQPFVMDHGIVYRRHCLLGHNGYAAFWVLTVPVFRNLEFSSRKRRVWEKKNRFFSKYTSVQRFHITWHKGLNPWNPIAERTALYFWMVFNALGLLQVHLRCSTRIKGWKRQPYLRVPGK